MIKNILQPFYTAYVIVIFAITFMLILVPIAIISLWNNLSARKVTYYIIKHWATVWLWLIGMPVTEVGRKPPKGKYIIIANHVSYIDSLVVFPVLPGYFRPLGKIEIAKIPLIGFIYKQIVILVDRKNEHSRARSMHLMYKILKHDGHILIFPEGSFNETEAPLKDFYNGAFRLALNSQVDILPVLLPDTVDRWHFSAWWKLWPGRNRVVFLEPVSMRGRTQDELLLVKQNIYSIMENSLVGLKKAS